MKPIVVSQFMKSDVPEDERRKSMLDMYDLSRKFKWTHAGEFNKHWTRRMLGAWGKDVAIRDWFRQPPRENVTLIAMKAQQPVLKERKPIPELNPYDRSSQHDIDGAILMSRTLQHFLETSNFDEMYDEFIWSMLFYPVAYMRDFWNPDLNGGAGGPVFDVPDPRNIYWNPGARSVKEALWVFEEKRLDVDFLINRYPEREEELISLVGEFSSSRSQGLFERLKEPFNIDRGSGVRTSTEVQNPRELIVLEMHVGIPDIKNRIPIEELKEGRGAEEIPIRTFVLVGGKLLLNSDPQGDPLPFSHNEIPYMAATANRWKDRIEGISDLEPTESLKQEHDRFTEKRSAFNDTAQFGWILNPKGSGLTKGAFKSGPNRVLRTRQGREPSFMEPPNPGRHVQSRGPELERVISRGIGIEKIGVDVLGRAVPVGTTLQVASVQEEPMRRKLQNMKPGMLAMFRRVALNIQDNTAKNTIVRYNYEDTEESFEISPEELKDIDLLTFDLKMTNKEQLLLDRNARFLQTLEVFKALDQAPNTPMEGRIYAIEQTDVPHRTSMVARMKSEQELIDLNTEFQKMQLVVQMEQLGQAQEQNVQQNDVNAQNPLASSDPDAIFQALEQNPELEEQALSALGV